MLLSVLALMFSFTVTPSVCVGPPCPVIILYTIEPDAANRNVNTVVEGDRDGSERREWDMALEGENAHRKIQVAVVLKANAEYEFRATLQRNDGKELHFVKYVKVGGNSENTRGKKYDRR